MVGTNGAKAAGTVSVPVLFMRLLSGFGLVVAGDLFLAIGRWPPSKDHRDHDIALRVLRSRADAEPRPSRTS